MYVICDFVTSVQFTLKVAILHEISAVHLIILQK